jgi:hypothetical protein
VIDGILYVLRTEGVNGKCYQKNTDRTLLVIIVGFSNGIALTSSKRDGSELKIYDDCIGINWTWQSIIDSISIKLPLGGRGLQEVILLIEANWEQKDIF